jgi:BirA family biotin operon repressor/biotin-[acetyl-CoA-carboxylase] ligase
MEHNWSIIQLNSTGSTNSYAKELIAGNKVSGELVVNAKSQLQGRGLGTNIWESDPGSNLTFSIVMKPKNIKAGEQFYISQAVSLGITDFLSHNKIDARIKWPNDILIGKKKIAGILIENSIMGSALQHSIIGIGLNVNQENFNHLADIAISMKNITGQQYSLDFALHQLLNCITDRVGELKSGQYEKLKESYLLNLYQYKKWGMYACGEREFRGMIKDVLPVGELLVSDESGKDHAFLFKEIEFL